MNREIKFRAWNEEDMYISRALSEGAHCLASWFDAHSVYHGPYGKESVFMQYTGLNDKNGNEIYEGDILKSFSPSVPCYEVFYDRCCFRLRYKLKSGEYYDWGPLFRMEEIFHEGRLKFHPEVIGNIYQNPELLTNPPLPQE